MGLEEFEGFIPLAYDPTFALWAIVGTTCLLSMASRHRVIQESARDERHVMAGSTPSTQRRAPARRSWLHALLVLALVIPLATTQASSEPVPAKGNDWLQWGGPNRDFRLESELGPWPASGPVELWRRPLGEGNSAVVGDRQRIVVQYHDDVDGTESDVVLALDTHTGREIWRQTSPARPLPFLALGYGKGPHSTPLIAGSTAFTVGWLGRLQALDLSTGEVRWVRELWSELDGTRVERGYAASPLFYDGLVILPVGGPGRALVAFHSETGDIAWSRHDYAIAYSSPRLVKIAGAQQLVALLDDVAIGVVPGTGELLWSHPIDNANYINTASPTVAGPGRLFFATVEGGLLLLVERIDGRFRAQRAWLNKGLGSQVANSVLVDGALFGTKGSSVSYQSALDAESGEQLWRDRRVGDANLLVVGGKALVFDDQGTLHLAKLNRENLELIASAELVRGRSWTAPTLIGSTLVVRSNREIAAFRLPLR